MYDCDQPSAQQYEYHRVVRVSYIYIHCSSDTHITYVPTESELALLRVADWNREKKSTSVFPFKHAFHAPKVDPL